MPLLQTEREKEADEIIKRLKGYYTIRFLDDLAYFKNKVEECLAIPEIYAKKENTK